MKLWNIDVNVKFDTIQIAAETEEEAYEKLRDVDFNPDEANWHTEIYPYEFKNLS